MKKFLSTAVVGICVGACATKEARLHDQQLVQALVQQKGAEAQACYIQELAQNPELPSGSIKIRFDKERGGQLRHPRLMDGFTYSEPIYNCIVSKARAWNMGEPVTMGPVDLTFNFQNDGPRMVKDEKFSELMKKHETKFAECFLKSRPNAKRAQIDFRFRQTPSGEVKELEQLHGFDGSDQVFGCMKNIISSWKLPPREEALKAQWSYRFEVSEPSSTNASSGESKKD